MLIKFKPTTPGLRGTVLVSKKELSKEKPFKALTKKLSSTGGRNNQGKITSRRMGGGVKRKYRSAFISLIKYEDGEHQYIISPKNIKIGEKIISGTNVPIKNGNCLPLNNIPVGTNIHNIELKPGAGAQLIRSAGSSAQIVSKEEPYVQIKLISGEIRHINKNCRATIGEVSNSDQKNIKLGKAGRKRYLGFRPKVRGVVMNPVDHPHGGGEGRTSGGRDPVTPWGVSTKGKKTRNNKKTDSFIIKRKKK